VLNAGLIVSKKAREILGDDLLKDVFEQARLTYVAESGDFLLEDVRANEPQGSRDGERGPKRGLAGGYRPESRDISPSHTLFTLKMVPREDQGLFTLPSRGLLQEGTAHGPDLPGSTGEVSLSLQEVSAQAQGLRV
jgi:hypothetical protein